MKKNFILYFFATALTITISCKKQSQDGLNSLLDITDFSGNQTCPAGGLVIKAGIDKNRNNILDSIEINNTKYVCNGQSGNYDKQVLLPINWSANTTNTIPLIGGELLKFSKKNYIGVDSIILVANPYVADITNTSTIELYNLTDNMPINNGRITTNSLYDNRNFLQTGNVYNALPDKEITLGISFKSGTNGMFAATGSCYLFLYRR